MAEGLHWSAQDKAEKTMEGKARGSSELRRIHVIYFLSHRVGCSDHPHLFRVHQVSRNGVYLRDIKRWLADLRGKDMPEAFSWSYKRRYRTGCIWQDLADDDVLYPISNNKYVLRGSEKLPSPSPPHFSSQDLTSPSDGKNQVIEIEAETKTKPGVDGASVVAVLSQCPSIEFGQLPQQQSAPPVGSEISTPKYVSLKHEQQEVQHKEKPPLLLDLKYNLSTPDNLETQNSSFSFSPFSKRKKTKKDKKKKQHDQTDIPLYNAVLVGAGAVSSTAQSGFRSSKSKRCSSGAAQVFRNLISCGAIDTKDAFLVVPHQPVEKPPSPGPPRHQEHPRIARRSFKGHNSWTWMNRNENERVSSSQKVVSTAHKPVSAPKCSQCGKSFRPEKLQYHMISCKGMKLILSRKSSAPTAATLEKKFPPVFVDAPLGAIAPASLLTCNN